MILHALLTGVVLCALYATMLTRVPASLRRQGATVHQGNFVRAESVIYAPKLPPNLIVGSSLSEVLRPELLGSEFATLAFGGGSTRTGLEIMQRSELRPQRVFIEANLLLKPADRELLEYLYAQPMSTVRRHLPLLRQANQPINLIFSWFQGRRLPPPVRPNAQLLEAGLRHHAEGDAEPLPVKQASEALEAAERFVHSLVEAGVEVVFVEFPTHPQIAGSPRLSAMRSAVQARFPPDRFRWIYPAADDSYQTTDGLHLVTASAARFANQLRVVAGLAALRDWPQ